ncbi:RNA polymerase, sigma-24 subunit, ECF subfamily [Kribbella flavida DSM 17836]|uniref:RNA polymerase, sigma-24 subunit, ECF subfamily n=1 Tax=Kribbella flavida (strain DSM 17836 / JCM 10339 / NBRC 14399) TaxID=479435 RepID=D2PRY0_KRIFD|nr:sigma-70 family RNA polymerase sigma factor [Kribbella flavida]ADB29310.1 RNA polymerase, sigma-24 subunit, ECF subfamily [Kribbella flavida DSM 17836]
MVAKKTSLPPFQLLLDEHWRDVVRLARALAGRVDGDDVAQRAWEKAYAAYPKLTSARNLRSWLLTITARCATDVHRARRPQSPLEEAPPVAVDGPDAAEWPDPILWKAVNALPERQRVAVTLKYVGDLDHHGVAAALGTTPAASRRLVSDALATLRTTLGADDE